MTTTATGASAPTRKTRPLAFRPRQKSPMRRLPFVGREHTADQSFSMWNVPASGGYFGGNTTGEAIATMYLRHIRETDAEICSPMLGGMVISWAWRLASGDITPGSVEENSLRGQMVGFAHVLSKWLIAAARHMGDSLETLGNDALLAKANRGVAFDTAAFLQYQALKDQFEENRRA
jgi:hypothetical protein